MTLFDNDIALAVAAYNAGPDAVLSPWPGDSAVRRNPALRAERVASVPASARPGDGCAVV